MLLWIVLCVTCLVCACLNRWMHTRAPAFIHLFKHSLAVKQCTLTIKYSSILKVMGLYTMSVSRKYVLAVLCLQMHYFKSTTSNRCIICSFPNNLTNVIIYPKTRFCFGRLGYTLLEFIIFIIIIFSTIHMLYQCIFTH